MENKVSKELAKHRLEQAKEDLQASNLLFENKFYKSANNRAYYSIDFKKHKDVIAYFNQHYIKKEIFPKELGHKIYISQTTREDSDYDDEYIVSREKTKMQIETAEELLNLIEKYIENN